MSSITSDSDDDDDMVGALVYKSSITAKVRALAAVEAKKAGEENRVEGDGPSVDNRDITRGRRGDSSTPELRIPLFPSRLYAMLENAADLSHSSAVSWNPDGRSFVVVPGHFKLAQFRSFVSENVSSRLVSSRHSFNLFALYLISERVHIFIFIHLLPPTETSAKSMGI